MNTTTNTADTRTILNVGYAQSILAHLFEGNPDAETLAAQMRDAAAIIMSAADRLAPVA